MKISFVIPVFNESKTVRQVVERVAAVPIDKEILVIDDGSNDGTWEALSELKGLGDGVRILRHEKNQGKGAAVRTGLAEARGEAVLIQDADLEYEPMDSVKLVQAMERAKAPVVYGSRFLEGRRQDPWWHYAANQLLTFCTNLLYGARLSDMETCYKLVRTDLLRELRLESRGFELEAEVTAKLLRRRVPIIEESIGYRGRSYQQGKKITWVDGIKAVKTLVRYRWRR